jgi:putative membrane protein
MHRWAIGAIGAWWGWGGSGGYGWPWPGLLWLIAFALFWGGLIALLVWAIRLSAASRRDNRDTRESSDEILKRRLASGEISEEEYERIRRILHDEPR